MKIYTTEPVRYVRISELPQNEQLLFVAWLVGRGRPFTEHGDDAAFVEHFLMWKFSRKAELEGRGRATAPR